MDEDSIYRFSQHRDFNNGLIGFCLAVTAWVALVFAPQFFGRDSVNEFLFLLGGNLVVFPLISVVLANTNETRDIGRGLIVGGLFSFTIVGLYVCNNFSLHGL